MIEVKAAEHIVLSNALIMAVEEIPLQESVGRVLGDDVVADRDLPPYDRVTMDGIAINYESIEAGIKSFKIKGTQGAGDAHIEIESKEECVEIMTGASLPTTTDTIIRYEDLDVANGIATLTTDNIKRGQNIHYKGSDRKQHQVLAIANQTITSALINTLASVGMYKVPVRRLPKVVVISTGDELVGIEETPAPNEVRRSNVYAIASVLLQEYRLQADLLHVADDKVSIRTALSDCLNKYDTIILSGGVSMGKYDYLPEVLEELQVEKLFHKVSQRPGKPFWFGVDPLQKPVFAFPGNPVSTFMCMYRYFVPWMNKTLQLHAVPAYAVLNEDYSFKPELQYFLQVKIKSSDNGQLVATPHEGNGSGDFVNLLETDAFMELPAEETNFKKGEVYRIWPFKKII
ncbi:MAG: molybdopterin molybdotransferase MoeA [Chitinophagaceae bacterium]|nr:molybdopterin molybdotransferase MoeA [Chitinophagaceae bacterium]